MGVELQIADFSGLGILVLGDVAIGLSCVPLQDVVLEGRGDKTSPRTGVPLDVINIAYVGSVVPS